MQYAKLAKKDNLTRLCQAVSIFITAHQGTRVMLFRKKTDTENCHEISEITNSFDQLNYFDKNKQHVLCVTLNIFIYKNKL